ncbi:uncharacterized protein [Lolium perenne]|uniref:uncharacterized protein n=1 Tax=Lolium perenne TaxID=4522 RepID=UPI003A99FA62
MEPNIANQLIGRATAASVWQSIHDLYGAQTRANVRHIRRQLVSTRKEDLSAAAYMQKMKALADAMAVAGVPITDDELIDYIVIGLGSAYNVVTAPFTLGTSTEAISYAMFYSNMLSFESLQAQQAHAEGWTSSVNSAMRPHPAFQGGGPPSRPFGNDVQQGPARTGGGGNSGYGRNDGGNYGRGDGGNFGGRNDGRTGGGNGGGWNDGRNNNRNGGGGYGQQRRWRPRCQICGNWGHVAKDCRNRFDTNYQPPQQRGGNAATTNYNNNPWIMDSGATDHLTSELARLQAYERYSGKDQVQVANGAGESTIMEDPKAIATRAKDAVDELAFIARYSKAAKINFVMSGLG